MIGYVIKNKVVKGNGLGKSELGFATAKVDFYLYEKIQLGCYRSKILVNDKLYLGITNISFNDYYISETHILSFKEDIYDKEIQIELLSFLRGPIISKSISESRQIISNDIIKFWHQKSCTNCKFCIGRDYGYSNWTVEGTNYSCLVEEYNGFIPIYNTQHALICPFFNEGEYWYIDVDQTIDEPSKNWFQAEYRDILINKIINE